MVRAGAHVWSFRGIWLLRYWPVDGTYVVGGRQLDGLREVIRSGECEGVGWSWSGNYVAVALHMCYQCVVRVW